MHIVFDKRKLILHKNRAAKYLGSTNHFLLEHLTKDLFDRLEGSRRKFNNILILGTCSSKIIPILPDSNYYFCDISSKTLKKSGPLCVVADEENLPFKNDFFDLIISPATLQFTNDLPGCLAQLRNSLSKNGIFLGNIISGDSLKELRTSLIHAEAKFNKVGSRVAPTIDVKTFGSLIQRVGFSCPVSDSEIIQVSYHNIFDLMHDLRYMGLSNCLNTAVPMLSRTVLDEANKYYLNNFPDQDLGIIATFEVITATGINN